MEYQEPNYDRWDKTLDTCPHEKKEWLDALHHYWMSEFYKRPSSNAKSQALDRVVLATDASRIAMLSLYGLEDLA